MRQMISNYKKVKSSNEFDEIDKLDKFIDKNKLKDSKDYKETKELKEYDILDIIKSFNTSKEAVESLIKETKNSINEMNAHQDYTISTNINTNANTNVTSSQIGNHQQSFKAPNLNYLINSSVILNAYNFENNLEYKDKFSNSKILNQLQKENTSLKLELKLLYDSLKQDNKISEIPKEDLDLKIRKSNPTSLTHSPDINKNRLNDQLGKDSNYLVKIGDEGKETFFLEIKNYIQSLRQSDFFI